MEARKILISKRDIISRLEVIFVFRKFLGKLKLKPLEALVYKRLFTLTFFVYKCSLLIISHM